MTNPANATVLITGAGGGFSKHVVRQFRAAGTRLILTDFTHRALRGVIADAGDDLVASVTADLATEEGCAAVAGVCSSRDVVAKILVGVRRNRLHVFPDKYARRIHYIARFAPWLLPLLKRRMENEPIEAGTKAD